MSLDLNTILKDWPHEPGMIKVRKVTGLDGREKLQLRIDLGVLHMEMRGRDTIIEFFQQSNFPELATKSNEVAFLEEWLEEVSAKRPRSKLELMQREMESAIAKELYEKAAELRDAIKVLKASGQTAEKLKS